MSHSVIEQLRDANPHPRTLPAPPIQTVRDRLDERPARADAPRPRRRSARGPASLLLTSAVAIAVFVLVVITLHPGHAAHDSGPASAGHPVHVAPQGTLAAPRAGMHGSVSSFGATALAADGSGIVSLQQCLGCKGDGNETPRSRLSDWLLSTNRSGTGTLTRTRYLLTQPQLSGRNGWASGVQSDGHGGGGTAYFFVTHDHGGHWTTAPSAAPNYGDQQLSLGFGEVWSVGQPGGATIVLHAPASGSRLVATGGQPTGGMWPNAQVAAAGSGMAYLYNGNAPRQMYVTRDNGQTWQRTARPCPAGQPGKLANLAFGNAVWVVCQRVGSGNAPGSHMTLARSTDGGRHWRELPTPFSAQSTPILSPVSASVIWGQAGDGAVLRSADGGMTWRTVWSLERQVRALRTTHLPGTYPGDLIAQGPNAATMQLSLVHGRPGSAAAYTNLVRYSTTDAGRTWRAQVLPLSVG